MKKLLIICILNSFITIGQNRSWDIYHDSIFPLLDSNQYYLAKEKFISLSKRYDIDPDYYIYFIKFSLLNGDEKFFKKNYKKLCSKYGFIINNYDSLLLEENNRYNLFSLINDQQLLNWTLKKTKLYHKKWLKENTNSIKINESLKQAKERDQLVRTITFRLYPDILNIDSICFNKVLKSYQKTITEIDSNNIDLIKKLCVLNNNYIPNNFDNGIGTFNTISLIIFHNLKRGKKLDQIRNEIFPLLEQAYIDYKISGDLFYTYDYHLNLHTGFQYYGTLPDTIPCIDKEHLESRKLRIKL